MTTIRGALMRVQDEANETTGRPSEAICHYFGIDPNWPEGSFVVTRRPPCPTCNGDGLDGSHEAALYYAARGELSPCSTCEGTGLLPAKWDSEQKCIDWLREQGQTPLTIHTPPGGAYTVWRGRLPDDRDPHYGSTLHLALLAACIAVQEAEQ